jgi:hypothetical protein
MAGPGAVVVAGFYTLWLAVKSDDGLVADDYYKRGLAINQTLTRTTRAGQLALGARVEFDAAAARVRVTLSGAGRLPETLHMTLVHPTRALADQAIELRVQTPGEYAGVLVAATAGRRVVVLEDSARTWQLAGEAIAGSRVVMLAPR